MRKQQANTDMNGKKTHVLKSIRVSPELYTIIEQARSRCGNEIVELGMPSYHRLALQHYSECILNGTIKDFKVSMTLTIRQGKVLPEDKQ